MEGSRVLLLVLLTLFVFLSPDTQQPTPSQQREIGKRIDGLQQALSSLRTTTYGDFDSITGKWINATGLREEDGFHWELLSVAQRAARVQFLSLFVKSGEVTQQDLEKGDLNAYASVAHTPLPLYQNVSGEVHGRVVRQKSLNVSTQLNVTRLNSIHGYSTDYFLRNFTEADGQISIHLSEEDRHRNANYLRDNNGVVYIRKIRAEISVYTDSSPGNGWQMRLYGVHFLSAGSILLTTTSEKFDGIFSLPNFALWETDFKTSQEVLNQSLSTRVARWDREREPVMPYRSTLNTADGSLLPVPSCEYIVWLQQHPVSLPTPGGNVGHVKNLLENIEHELRYPEGAPVPGAPPITFSAVVLSPDCGFILESQERKGVHLSGPKQEVYWTLFRRIVMFLILVLGMQVALLKRQMNETLTPSTRSRIAYESVGMMAYGDAFAMFVLVGFQVMNDSMSLLIMAASFCCILNVYFLEMKFIFDIWTIQVGDPRQRDRERQLREAAVGPVSASAPAPINLTSAPPGLDAPSGLTTGLPLPVTTPRFVDTGATPIIIPPDQDLDAAAAEDGQAAAQTTTAITRPRNQSGLEFSALYTRFFFTLVVHIMLTLWVTTWPILLRSAYINFFCFLYLSFWIPQLYRNVMRNCRHALRWEYVLGMSVLRLVPIVYCYTNTDNIFGIEADWTAPTVLVGWVWLQVILLASQQFLGPRLLVKERWCPEAYDYHPVLHDSGTNDLEAGSVLPVGIVASASEAKEKVSNAKEKDNRKHNRRMFDCAICMNEIDVPVMDSRDGVGMGSSWLERRNYMVTPCRHIFHSECLEGWMRLRLVCPICREGLPPL